MNDFISFLLSLLLPLFCCICGVIEVKHAKSEQQSEESDMGQRSPNRAKAIAIGLAKCICAFGALYVVCIYIIGSSDDIIGCLFLIAVAILIFWHIYLKRLLGKSKLMTQKSISEWSTIGNCAIIMPIILLIMYGGMLFVYAYQHDEYYNKYKDDGTVFTQILQEIGSVHASIMAGILFATAVLGILIIYRTRNNRG